MSGYARGGRGGGGRGSSAGGAMAALRKGMPPRKGQPLAKGTAGPSSAGRGVGSGSSTALDESFQLVCPPQGSSQFAMTIRLTPGLLDEIKRIEADGGAMSMKFGANASGHLIKVGQEEFKFSSVAEQGDLCDIFEEQRPGEDGHGMLTTVGSVWRKLSIHRTLSASEKDSIKKRSVEAEQQSRSRKAIVLDSLMKNDASSSEAVGRRPPVKAKKEPPSKKRKIAAPAPAKSKPHPLQAKDKPVSAPSEVAASASIQQAPQQQPQQQHQQPQQQQQQQQASKQQPVQPLLAATLPNVEEITLGSVAQPLQTVQKQKVSSTTTPEVPKASVVLNPSDMRNSLIMLLMGSPKGLTKKQLETSVGEPWRNMEKVLRSIASFVAPGRYVLNPGVKPEPVSKPSPRSGSLPDTAAADSPDSVAGPADSAAEKKPAASDQRNVDSERIEVLEAHRSPVRAVELTNAMQEDSAPAGACEHARNGPGIASSDKVQASDPGTKAASSGSSSSSGSGSDSDSDSDSTSSESGSASGSGSGSGSDTGSSSSSDEDEDVDIMSEDENHQKQKTKKASKHDKSKASKSAPEKPPFELHKEVSRSSEDIDIGDPEDGAKAADVVSCEGGSPAKSPPKSNSSPMDIDTAHASEELARTKGRQVPRPFAGEQVSFDQTAMAKPQNRSVLKSSDKVPEAEDAPPRKNQTEYPPTRNKTTPRRPQMELRKSENLDVNVEAPPVQEVEHHWAPPSFPALVPAVRPGRSSVKDALRRSKPVQNGSDGRRTDSRGSSDLELGEFRETTPEATMNKNDEQLKSRANAEGRTTRRTSPLEATARTEHTRTSGEQPSVRPIRRDSHEETAPARRANDRALGDNSQAKRDMDRKAAFRKPAVRSDDFFAPYEKETPESKGPIKSYEQYLEYHQEFLEKHPVYMELTKSIESLMKTFEALHREVEMAEHSNDKIRLASVHQKVRDEYQHSRKRFRRMTNTVLLLHEELQAIKDRCSEYLGQQV